MHIFFPRDVLKEKSENTMIARPKNADFFFTSDVLKWKSEKTNITWPKNEEPKNTDIFFSLSYARHHWCGVARNKEYYARYTSLLPRIKSIT